LNPSASSGASEGQEQKPASVPPTNAATAKVLEKLLDRAK
jgi:hypothetical protein